MKRGLTLLLIIVAIVLVIYFAFSGVYNTMVSRSEDTQAKWSLVESQYQRRADLFENVVNTIKGSAEFEKGTLEAVIQARASATSVKVDPTKLTPESIQEFQAAQNNLNSAFSRLLLTVEQYPQLQTTQAFRDFQAQIEGTENRINKARDDFNMSVQNYNTYIKRYPNNILANLFGFTEKGYFKAAEGTEKAPEVKF
jgi:LemA protein